MTIQNENLSDRLQRVLGVYEKGLTDEQLIEHVSQLNKLARRVVINDVHTKFWLDCWVGVEENSDNYKLIRELLNRAAGDRGKSITSLKSFYRDNAQRDSTETGVDVDCQKSPVNSGEKQ
jgi:hypothetical protein